MGQVMNENKIGDKTQLCLLYLHKKFGHICFASRIECNI